MSRKIGQNAKGRIAYAIRPFKLCNYWLFLLDKSSEIRFTNRPAASLPPRPNASPNASANMTTKPVRENLSKVSEDTKFIKRSNYCQDPDRIVTDSTKQS